MFDVPPQMLITIRTLNAQRKLSAQNSEELDRKIKEIYKTDKYQLYSNQEKTKQVNLNDLKDKDSVFMEYQMGQVEEFKPEMKCTHSPEAVCPKCVDIERTKKVIEPGKFVKYLSYGSYLELLKDRSLKEEIFDYQIKPCEDHLSNQKCSKCMEKTISLSGQAYRQIDYVEFDSKSIIENFIGRFKETNRQKLGFLIGKYQNHDDFPLGKKAVVSGIWEIEQESFPDGVVLNDFPTEFFTDQLEIVGVIYTDLFYKNGEITSFKKLGDYLISTVELSFINFLRTAVGNKAFFGVCVAVDSNNDVSTEVFMISEQFSALCKANSISLTTDPTLFKANREIIYNVIDKYGNTVSKKADPFFPLHYFVIKCENGYKENPLFLHSTEIKKPTPRKLSEYFNSDFRIDKFKNFSILTMLNKFIPNVMCKLVDSVIKNDQILLNTVIHTEEFKSFKKELEKYDVKTWSCSACTYLNQAHSSSCEICGTLK